MKRFFASASEQPTNTTLAYNDDLDEDEEDLNNNNQEQQPTTSTSSGLITDDEINDKKMIHVESSITTNSPNSLNENNNDYLRKTNSESNLNNNSTSMVYKPRYFPSPLPTSNSNSSLNNTTSTIGPQNIQVNYQYFQGSNSSNNNSTVNSPNLNNIDKMSKLIMNPTLLPGETIEDKDTQVYEWNGHLSPNRIQWHQGVLYLTNYRLIFKPSVTSTYDDIPNRFEGSDIPLCSIHKLEKIGGKTNSKDFTYLIEIFTKDFKHVKFAFVPSRGTRGRIFKYLREERLPNQFFAYCYKLHPSMFEVKPNDPYPVINGWDIYDIEKEFKRQGVFKNVKPHWRVCNVNQNYKICDTYPRRFLVPSQLTDEEVKIAATYRSRGRIPVLSWYDPESQCSLTRSSQPLAGFNITMNKNKQQAALGDYRMIESIMQASDKQQSKLMIVDLRPRANAEANRVIKGAGYEKNYKNCELRFLNIENIHIVRGSFQKLMEICHDFGGIDLNWYSRVETTNWIEHVRSILMASNYCVDVFFREKTSVLAHCSDGWDRTSQVVSLFQMMVDPYFRTMEGFAVLVEKEWCGYGHQFHKRIGHGLRNSFFGDERGPIFVQFMDCVYQLVRQHPTCFEYNENFLIFVLDQLYNCRFGNFLFDTERERVKFHVYDKTCSLWTYLLNRRVLLEMEGTDKNYVNPFYDPENTNMIIYYDLRHSSLNLWSTYWLRYAKDPNGYEYYGSTPITKLQSRADQILLDITKLQEVKSLSESKNEATVQTFQREFKNMWEEIQTLKKKNSELEDKYKQDTEALLDLCEKQKEELQVLNKSKRHGMMLLEDNSDKKEEPLIDNTTILNNNTSITINGGNNNNEKNDDLDQVKRERDIWREKAVQLQLELLNNKPTTSSNSNNSEVEKLKQYIRSLEETIDVLKKSGGNTNLSNGFNNQSTLRLSPLERSNSSEQFGDVNTLWRTSQNN
ncbi:hypothetical protein ABK040_011157 [Willaertia magna]